MDWTWGWTAIAAIATCVLAAGVFLAFWEIGQARRSTNAQIAMELFKQLRSDEALRILRFIYTLKPEDAQKLSPDQKNEITYVLERLAMLGALVSNRIIDEKLAIGAYGGATVLKCWYQLKDYINEVEKRQGLQWGRYIQDFASRALEYWKDYKKEVLYYRNEGDEPIDLVKTLREDKTLCPKRLKKQNYLRDKGEV